MRKANTVDVNLKSSRYIAKTVAGGNQFVSFSDLPNEVKISCGYDYVSIFTDTIVSLSLLCSI